MAGLDFINKIPRRLLFIAWIGFILVATALPVKEIPISSKIHFDKVVHLAMFLVLGFLAAKVIGIFYYLLVAVSLALISEFQQYFIPGRTVDFFDLLSNLVGVFFGLVMFYAHFHRRLFVLGKYLFKASGLNEIPKN